MASLISEQELFWTAFEPKTKNRFLAFVDGIPGFMIKKITRPNYRQEAKPIDHINLQRYVKGKTIWGPMQITLYDPIVPSASQAIMEWTRLHHESVTGRDGYAEFYKKDLLLVTTGPVGDKVEEWVVKGAMITEMNLGEFDWSDNGTPIEFTITVQPDYCVQNY
jgi:hypothetical protein